MTNAQSETLDKLLEEYRTTPYRYPEKYAQEIVRVKAEIIELFKEASQPWCGYCGERMQANHETRWSHGDLEHVRESWACSCSIKKGDR